MVFFQDWGCTLKTIERGRIHSKQYAYEFEAAEACTYSRSDVRKRTEI